MVIFVVELREPALATEKPSEMHDPSMVIQLRCSPKHDRCLASSAWAEFRPRRLTSEPF